MVVEVVMVVATSLLFLIIAVDELRGDLIVTVVLHLVGIDLMGVILHGLDALARGGGLLQLRERRLHKVAKRG